MLPNLQCRTPIHQGQNPGLTNRVIGDFGGVESVAATIPNMPAHTHAITSNLAVATSISLANPPVGGTVVPSDTNAYIGGSTGGPTSANIFCTGAGTNPITQKGVSSTLSGAVTADSTGSGLPMQIISPFLVLNFSIAMTGYFPVRD
jgi:microcystin-dependent protein